MLKEDASAYSLELLQAINDWQRGGNRRQKRSCGIRLKGLASALNAQFRHCDAVCFRQVELDKSFVWKLGDTLHLTEEISSWTLNFDFAKEFKGGVPPPGSQGVIFALKPDPNAVVLNLAELCRDPTFFQECERLRSKIRKYRLGIGHYRDNEAEVILEVSELKIDDVYALGGYSSDRITLARENLWQRTKRR